jgi:hypothetical protein
MVRTQHGGLPNGASALGEGSWVCVDYTPDRPLVGRVSLPDKYRDEDDYYEEDEIVEYSEHHCIVLTLDQWICEDCGVSFDRDPAWGDFPEEAIIEGGVSCVAYTPEEEKP